MELYVGLDVHSKDTVYCVQNKAGEVISEGQVATSEASLGCVLKKLRVPPGSKVGLETGTQAHWMAEVVFRLGMEPVVIDAAEVRSKARRKSQKSDKRDAFEICDGLRRDQWQKIVWLPPAEISQLRKALSRRRHFVKVCVSQISSAKFILRSHGLRTAGLTLQTAIAWEKMIKLHPQHAEYLGMHRDLWKMATDMTQKLDKQIERLMEPFAQADRRLRTFFGVGPVTSASLIAALGKPERFGSSGEVVSYLGLAPSSYDSGEQQRRGHITRQGPSWARSALVECAQQARRVRHPLQPYFARLSSKRGAKCAIVAIAARLARILWRMWLDEKEFDLSKLNVQRRTKVTKRTTQYQIKETTASQRA